MPRGLAIAGDRVIVNDQGAQRLSIWDLEGVHVGDIRMSEQLARAIFGTDAGSIVGAVNRRPEDGVRMFEVAMFSAEGTETIRYGAPLPWPEDVFFEDGDFWLRFPRLAGVPSYAAAPSGELYAAVGEEYQVVAFDPSGSPLWALRVNRQRQTFDEAHKNAVLDSVRDVLLARFGVQIAPGAIEWQEFLHTIGWLGVDGHGHLYVFPSTSWTMPTETFENVFRDLGPDELRVEVYSREGERLVAGTMTPPRAHVWNRAFNGGWSAASGDFVYSLRRNEQTEELELVRYRLVEPFE